MNIELVKFLTIRGKCESQKKVRLSDDISIPIKTVVTNFLSLDVDFVSSTALLPRGRLGEGGELFIQEWGLPHRVKWQGH